MLVRAPRLAGRRVRVLGAGPLAAAVREALATAGARAGEPADALVVLAVPPADAGLDAAMAEGFHAPARAIREALPELETRRGRIVAVTGPEAGAIAPGRAGASAAGHALLGLLKSARVELAAGRRGARLTLVLADRSDPGATAAAVLSALRRRRAPTVVRASAARRAP